MTSWGADPAADPRPDSSWRRQGTYVMNRAFVPLLLKGHEKTSITVTSAGAWLTKPGGSAYQGSKTAQVRMINHFMVEHRDEGVLAYAVHPGIIKTTLALGMPKYMHATIPSCG